MTSLTPPPGSRIRLHGRREAQVFTIPHSRLTKWDFVLHRLLGEALDMPGLSRVQTLSPRGVKKARGQEVLLPPDHVNYPDYWDAYLFVDFVGRAVAAKNATMWQEGFDTVPVEKGRGMDVEKQRADDLLQALEADIILPEGTLYGIVFGNMWWEPLRTTDGKLAELKPLDPVRMAAVVNPEDVKAGTVSEWVQLGPTGKEEGRWDGDELIHLRFNRYIGSPFGIGDLQKILLTVKQLLYMEQKLPEIVRKRADPTTWRMIANLVNGQLVPLSQKDFDAYKAVLSAIEPTEDIYSGPQVQKIEEVYKGAGIAARQGLESFLDHFKRKLQSGLAVPDILLGEGRMTTEATATEQTELYHQDIRWKQRIVKRLIERELFTREKPPIQTIKVEPNPLTPDDIFQTSQRLVNELNAGIIGPKFARKQLGYEEAEASEGAGSQKMQPGQPPQGPAKMPERPLPEQPSETVTLLQRHGKPIATSRRIAMRRKHG